MGLNSNDRHNAEDAINHQTVARQEAFYNQPQMLLHSKSKEFYSPDHSKKSNYVPDLRSTLYWNPSLDLNSRFLTYYNHDNTGRIKVILEGFTNEGKPFRSVSFYEIRK